MLHDASAPIFPRIWHHPMLTLCVVMFITLIGGTAYALGDYHPATDAWAFTKALGAQPMTPASSDSHDEQDGRPTTWTFSPNVRLHPDEGGQHIWPDIARAADGTIGVAWMDDHIASNYHIFYVYSTDGGMTWSAPERVDDRTTGSYSKFVSLAFTPSGIAVAVWEDDRTGGINVYFSKRDPAGGGTPWTANQRINTAGGSPSGGDFMNPSLAVLDDQRYFVAWTDWREGVFYQVYGRGTWDGGRTWGTEHRISDELGYQPVAGDPCVIFDPASGPLPGQEILCCVTNDWRGYAPAGRYPNVYFYRSTDGGTTWSIGVRVNDTEPYYQQASSHALVHLDDGRLASGWLNNPTIALNHFNVCLSYDDGATWQPSVQVDEPSPGGTGTYSSIATDGTALFAAFDIYETNWNAYFRASSDGGVTWPDHMLRMDDNPGSEATSNPVLAASSASEVHAAWSDGRAPGYNWKVYFATGTAEGASVADRGASAGSGVIRWRVVPNPSRVGEPLRLVRDAPQFGASAAERAPAALVLFDALGRCVATWSFVGSDATWNGTDARDHLLPAGCYWLRSAGDAPAVRIMRIQ